MLTLLLIAYAAAVVIPAALHGWALAYAVTLKNRRAVRP